MRLSESVLKLILEGRVSVARGRRLRYGKYRVLRRYVPADGGKSESEAEARQ